MSCDHNYIPCRNFWGRKGWICVRCNRWTQNFKVSDTPLRGPEEISGHAHEAPHESKEIA